MLTLDNAQTDLLMTNLDEEGKLSFIKAFKLAQLIGVKIDDMIQAIKNMNIEIINYDLSMFKKLSFNDFDEQVYEVIKEKQNDVTYNLNYIK